MDPRICWAQPEHQGPAHGQWNRCLSALYSKQRSGSSQSVSDSGSEEADARTFPTTSAVALGGPQQSGVGRLGGPLASAKSPDDNQKPIINDQDDTLQAYYMSAAHILRRRAQRNRACTYGFNFNHLLLTSKYGGTPWLSPDRVFRRDTGGLHEEIIEFYRWMKPTRIEYEMRRCVFERISLLIREHIPDAEVGCFGSFATGIFLPTSDIDVVVSGSWQAGVQQVMYSLAGKLRSCDFVHKDSVKILDRATVPIIKMVDSNTEIRVDISFNMPYGVPSAQLITNFLDEFPPLVYLVYVLKQFLLQRDLNEVFTGGVSSYSLILLTVSFLQMHASASVRQQPCADSEHNLGVLLMQLLELYGRRFNYLTTAIRVKDRGSYAPKEEMMKQFEGGHKHSMLCIEDPLNPTNDIGRSSHGVLKVKQAFDYAYGVLLSAVLSTCAEDYDPNNRSILSRIVRVTDSVIDYRLALERIAHTTLLPNDMPIEFAQQPQPMGPPPPNRRVVVPANMVDQKLMMQPHPHGPIPIMIRTVNGMAYVPRPMSTSSPQLMSMASTGTRLPNGIIAPTDVVPLSGPPPGLAPPIVSSSVVMPSVDMMADPTTLPSTSQPHNSFETSPSDDSSAGLLLDGGDNDDDLMIEATADQDSSQSSRKERAESISEATTAPSIVDDVAPSISATSATTTTTVADVPITSTTTTTTTTTLATATTTTISTAVTATTSTQTSEPVAIVGPPSNRLSSSTPVDEKAIVSPGAPPAFVPIHHHTGSPRSGHSPAAVAVNSSLTAAKSAMVNGLTNTTAVSPPIADPQQQHHRRTQSEMTKMTTSMPAGTWQGNEGVTPPPPVMQSVPRTPLAVSGQRMALYNHSMMMQMPGPASGSAHAPAFVPQPVVPKTPSLRAHLSNHATSPPMVSPSSSSSSQGPAAVSTNNNNNSIINNNSSNNNINSNISSIKNNNNSNNKKADAVSSMASALPHGLAESDLQGYSHTPSPEVMQLLENGGLDETRSSFGDMDVQSQSPEWSDNHSDVDQELELSCDDQLPSTSTSSSAVVPECNGHHSNTKSNHNNNTTVNNNYSSGSSSHRRRLTNNNNNGKSNNNNNNNTDNNVNNNDENDLDSEQQRQQKLRKSYSSVAATTTTPTLTTTNTRTCRSTASSGVSKHINRKDNSQCSSSSSSSNSACSDDLAHSSYSNVAEPRPLSSYRASEPQGTTTTGDYPTTYNNSSASSGRHNGYFSGSSSRNANAYDRRRQQTAIYRRGANRNAVDTSSIAAGGNPSGGSSQQQQSSAVNGGGGGGGGRHNRHNRRKHDYYRHNHQHVRHQTTDD